MVLIIDYNQGWRAGRVIAGFGGWSGEVPGENGDAKNAKLAATNVGAGGKSGHRPEAR